LNIKKEGAVLRTGNVVTAANESNEFREGKRDSISDGKKT